MQVTQRMPDKDIQTLREIVAPIAKGVWALVALGFMGGVWATTLQGKVEQLESWADERNTAITEYNEWRRDMATKVGEIDAKLEILLKRVEK